MRQMILFSCAMVAALHSRTAEASWLSKITGVHVNVSKGTVRIEAPDPAAIPEMLKQLPVDYQRYFLNPASPALAEAIRWSKNRAGGGAPIPQHIRSQLMPFFPPKILDKARFNKSKATLSLPAAVQTLNKDYAVTLDNLIVFSDQSTADNPVLWAHELVHVTQYDNMGIDAFADLYTASFGEGLEKAAREYQEVVRQALAQGPVSDVVSAYSVGANALSTERRLAQGQFAAAARAIIPPDQCVQGDVVQYQPNVLFTNICPVPVRIIQVALHPPTPWAPQPLLRCQSDCVIPPRTSKVHGPMPGPVARWNFAFIE